MTSYQQLNYTFTRTDYRARLDTIYVRTDSTHLVNGYETDHTASVTTTNYTLNSNGAKEPNGGEAVGS